jgi:hypothetical protein
MDAAVVGVAGTLLGGLVGGLLTHWNSTALARLQMRWQQVRLRQEKLEEIAALLDQIDQHFKKLMGEVILKVENDTPFELNGERIPFERLRILMEFYAPTMIDEWPRLEKERELFSTVLVDAIPAVRRTKPEKQEINGRAVSAQIGISKVCRSLSEKAVSLAHEAVSNEVANKAN